MTPDHFTRGVNATYRAEAEVLGWIFQGITSLLITAAIGMLILAGIMLLAYAGPGVVMFRYRARIVARFCPQYRRPEKNHEETSCS
jgi:hypothetical protein